MEAVTLRKFYGITSLFFTIKFTPLHWSTDQGVTWKQSMSNVLEYLKDRYDEEQDRFAHFEEKCSKLLTLLSILIAALGSIAAVKSPLAFPPTSVLQWLLVAALLGAIFSLICAWGHTLLALKIDDCPVMPLLPNEGL